MPDQTEKKTDHVITLKIEIPGKPIGSPGLINRWRTQMGAVKHIRISRRMNQYIIILLLTADSISEPPAIITLSDWYVYSMI